MNLYLVYIMCCVKYIQTQYLPVNRRVPNSCDPAKKGSLVEHFFNMIFTEFHNTPPVCVCVQMCVGQSTYCYPKGCLKREDRKREVAQPVSLIETAQSSIFLVDQKDVTRDLYSIGYENFGDLDTKTEVTSEKQVNIVRPDPFKDKFKSLFKYKRMPKIEVKYNLREQVRNTKSDVLRSGSVDISHTRWPQTKRNKLNGYTNLPDLRQIYPSSVKPTTFFISALPEKDLVAYPIRYFKRDLTNIDETKYNISVNLSKEVSTSTFSLETWIENIIESNFVSNNNITNQSKSDESNKTISSETTEYYNETDILFINSTVENLDNSKYTEAINYTNLFNELIAKLSKKIDRQNNTSMEMMRKLSNDVIIGDEISNEIDKEVSQTERTASETALESTISVVTTLASSNTIINTVNTTEQAPSTITNDYNEVETMKKDKDS